MIRPPRIENVIVELQCAKCRRPVQRLEKFRDESRMFTVYIAHCHGAQERTEIPDAIASEFSMSAFGLAFDAPRALPEST